MLDETSTWEGGEEIRTHAELLLRGPITDENDRVLSVEALDFVADLVARFGDQRDTLLAARRERQQRLDAGELPDFLQSTRAVRESDWQVRPVPAELQDRRVEITGPVERKMIINALNSGAQVFMADFEDSTCPTWVNLLQGQANLMDAVRGSIEFTAPDGRQYRLKEDHATLMVRPRGWHLPEAHVLFRGQTIPGALFDFGLFMFHNANELVARGSAPYFYLPKLESHLEARLWNQVIDRAEDQLGLARGTVRCTVLIETILAAFEMDEILYELREHIVGLNCGRWDYIFSYIRSFANDASRVLPDRSQVTMAEGFLRAYSQLLIRTCHRRGAHAMGGMSAFIPIKADAAANEAAMARVRADKEREAGDGHDGTWVAHPGLVSVAREIFDRVMPAANQTERLREDVSVSAADLLAPQVGTVSAEGLRGNLRVALQYLAAWLGGSGCVPIDNLMEDAATAEIARAQVWQWLRAGVELDDGRRIDAPLVDALLAEEIAGLSQQNALGLTVEDLNEAGELLADMIHAADFPRFLTLPAYQRVLAREIPI